MTRVVLKVENIDWKVSQVYIYIGIDLVDVIKELLTCTYAVFAFILIYFHENKTTSIIHCKKRYIYSIYQEDKTVL